MQLLLTLTNKFSYDGCREDILSRNTHVFFECNKYFVVFEYLVPLPDDFEEKKASFQTVTECWNFIVSGFSDNLYNKNHWLKQLSMEYCHSTLHPLIKQELSKLKKEMGTLIEPVINIFWSFN